MTEQHQITPPLELKRQWIEQPTRDDGVGRELWLIDRAAEWGYDQRGEVNEAKLQQARDEELEACCKWLSTQSIADALCSYDLEPIADNLRAARRQKPPSLKEQALEEVGVFEGMGTCNIDIIRRALEAIPDE